MSQRLEMFVIYDRIGGIYDQPFFAPNRGCVHRSLTDLKMSGQSSNLVLHPSDYEIYTIGFYFSDNCRVEPLEKPDYWCKVSDIIPLVGPSTVDPTVSLGAAVGAVPPQVAERTAVKNSSDAENISSIPACEG